MRETEWVSERVGESVSQVSEPASGDNSNCRFELLAVFQENDQDEDELGAWLRASEIR